MLAQSTRPAPPAGSALQSILDDLCTLNGRIVNAGNIAQSTADALFGSIPTNGTAGRSDKPSMNSRVEMFGALIAEMRGNMDSLEQHVSRFTSL